MVSTDRGRKIMIERLLAYLQYPFVIYALIVGTLISLCAALLGVTLVLRRFSYIGTSLSNVSFGAMAVASVCNISNNIAFTILVTVLAAVWLLRGKKDTLIQGDASLAMISVSSLAIGYLIMNLFASSTNLASDVCITLFGSTSILTLTQTEVYLCIGLTVAVVGIFLLCYNKIFAITFDENFSVAIGGKVEQYNLLIAVITAVIIVLSMKLVGSLLITALILFPVVSSMQVFKNFQAVVISSAVFGVICSILGMLASILAGTPVGSTIVAVDIIGFLIFVCMGKVRGMIG